MIFRLIQQDRLLGLCVQLIYDEWFRLKISDYLSFKIKLDAGNIY